ncbi:MAG: sel1 repeat family protein, partial [archaeon]|nr:sel1 repeat family protein [archaeon]
KWTYREALNLVKTYNSPKAPAMMLAIAEKGENRAYLYLARMYREGKVVEKDIPTSLEYYRVAFSKKVPDSGDELLWVLWSLNTEASCREVVRIADQVRSPSSEGYLGRAYRHGKAVEKDLDKAAVHMRNAYRFGVKWAAAELFDILWNIGTPEAKKEMITVASSSDDPECLGRLGRAYRMGKGVKQDIPKSIRAYVDSRLPWALEEAYKALSQYEGADRMELMGRLADAGVRQARSEVEQYYLKKKDFSKASMFGSTEYPERLFPKMWDAHAYGAILELAETSPSPMAELYLGKVYRYGAGVEKDLTVSAGHLRKALEGGIEGARPDLFDVLWNIGTPESKEEMIRIVTGSDDPECLGRLGRAYRMGKGVKQDMAAAVRCCLSSKKEWACREVANSVYEGRLTVDGRGPVEILEEMASYGVSEAEFYVGKMYRFGTTVDKDLQRSAEHLRKAVAAGIGEARFHLFDVLWNMEDASVFSEMVGLVREGAEEGDPECMGRLGRAYKAGFGVPKDKDLSEAWLKRAASKDEKWKKEI